MSIKSENVTFPLQRFVWGSAGEVSQFLLTHLSTGTGNRGPYCSVKDNKSSDDGNDGGLSKLLPYLQVGEVEVKWS